jgi:hypothetical protein
MTVVFKPDARIVVLEIVDFINSINTPSAGSFWEDRLVSYLRSYALPNVTYALCNNDNLASLGLSCINFNDWIIAFKIERELFVVHKIIRGSILA